MQVRLSKPFGYSEIGGRSNNEDSVFPNPEAVSRENQLFIVCDGVGGAEKGEIASELACRSFAGFFEDHVVDISDQSTIDKALNFVEESFDEYFIENPSSKGMATTATLLHFHTKGATVAHIGDSRVYLIRDGSIIFQTKDHSFAMELFEGGFITLEEAQKHPRKNEITRAIQGKTVRPTHADVTNIEDLRAGDVFVLCTDGVLERVDENSLEDIIKQYQDTSMIGQALINISMGQTRDNFSAYIVKIEEVNIHSDKQVYSENISNMNDLAEETQGTRLKAEVHPVGPSVKKNRIWVLMMLIIAVVTFAGFIVYKNKSDELFKVAYEKKSEAKKDKIDIKTGSDPKTDSKTDALPKNERSDIKEDINSSDYTDVHKWNGFLTLIKKGNSFGLRSTATKSIRLKPEFDEISDKEGNSGNYHWVIKEGKYGFIYLGKNGIKFLNTRYDSVMTIRQKDGKAVVKVNNAILTLNLQEEFENKNNRSKIKSF